MDKPIQTGELRDEVRRLLRCRIPLILALLVNFAFLVRVPITQMWADAASPLPRPPVHAVSQEIEIMPAESAAPAEVSPFASSSERAVQRLSTHPSAPSPQTDPAANGGQAAEPVSIPDTTAVAEPPALSHAGASPHSYRVDSPPTGLTIRNVLENAEPVRFLINGRVHELQPGETHEFAAETSWTVQFDRGESFGNAKQTLVPGAYRFVVTSQGWNLEANR